MATAVNPTKVSFGPSPDHDATDPSGVPMVDHYDLTVSHNGDPAVTFGLGKPTPESGTITAPLPPEVMALPKGEMFVATVAAVGPSGSGVSDPSNPFSFANPPAKPGTPVLS